MKITKEQIKAIRQANDICFRFKNGEHTIEASKRIKDTVYGDTTARADIPVSGQLHAYNPYGNKQGDISGAFYYLGSCKFDPVWQTIISLLRADDDITLVWSANNDSEAMVDHGVFNDQLNITVVRGKKTMEFCVFSGTYTSQTARMCTRDPVVYSIAV